ncbi:hypothetical protein LEP1GSC188_1542 [Leptospira weilii serovar Topaz str. LT2116]|uniref:Uncharacterized protein n=1 Tax=Leptospira weilii serovar Topaz str. LT2116 TaxID=1088540 RepID=M3EF16_9LEPT|nr:hypothetical protein LEP1GSC188_1542 [Leptospira weilii serovar Topaz str. LT2116]
MRFSSQGSNLKSFLTDRRFLKMLRVNSHPVLNDLIGNFILWSFREKENTRGRSDRKLLGRPCH